jgi:hypothetical protein
MAVSPELLAMIDGRWLDRGTRALVITFTVYNTNTRLLTNVRLLTEYFTSAMLVGTFRLSCESVTLGAVVPTPLMCQRGDAGHVVRVRHSKARGVPVAHRPGVLLFLPAVLILSSIPLLILSSIPLLVGVPSSLVSAYCCSSASL